MQSIDRIHSSDETSNASEMTIQTVRSIGATTIVVDTVEGVPTDFFASMGTPHTFIDPVTNEEITVISEATCVDFAGHIDSGNLIIDTIAPGYTDGGSAVGDIVVIRPTTQWADNVADVLAESHNDDGSLKSSLPIISPMLEGTIDGWVGANESWAYASGSTITVPTDARTKYDVGDYIKLTQTTVKYFVVTAVAATLLTVAGITGETVANAPISVNSYSKARNPHGATNGAAGYVGCKFFVYLNSASISLPNNNFLVMAADAKLYDTGSNVDIVTNKGRFTAPVPGFYRFDWCINMDGGSGAYLSALYKNGSSFLRAGEVQANFGTSGGGTTIPLAAGDYVEVAGFQNSGNTGHIYGAGGTLPYQSWFSGELRSRL